MRLLITDPFRDGHYNMALDQALAESVARGSSGPVLRFYGWLPPAISLGHHQPVTDVDWDACRRAGVDVVRRPTGGRAVYHRDEFTYAAAAPETDPVIGGTVLETYRAIALGLLAGLRRLGIAAEMARPGPAAAGAHGNPLCFAAAGRYEILVDGRKIVGSAQRRLGGAALQQGALLLAQPQDDPLFGGHAGQAKSVTAAQALGRPVTFSEMAGAMRIGFAEAWGADLEQSLPTADEERRAEELAATARESIEAAMRKKSVDIN